MVYEVSNMKMSIRDKEDSIKLSLDKLPKNIKQMLIIHGMKAKLKGKNLGKCLDIYAKMQQGYWV